MIVRLKPDTTCGYVRRSLMKIATWNVNGIRARQGELQQWIDRERPDVVCLQEIKATSGQVPAALCEMEGYWCYWHGGKGYSGVGLHISKAVAPERPLFVHPAFDYEKDRKSTRLNSSHSQISYAVFCLKKKKKENNK